MKRVKKRGVVFYAVVTAASLEGAALAHVWLRMQVVQLGYEIAREKRAAEELSQAGRHLRVEVDLLKNPSRVESIALRELKMAPADPTRIRVAQEERRSQEARRQFAKR